MLVQQDITEFNAFLKNKLLKKKSNQMVWQVAMGEGQCGFCKEKWCCLNLLEILNDSTSTEKGSLGQEKNRDMYYTYVV